MEEKIKQIIKYYERNFSVLDTSLYNADDIKKITETLLYLKMLEKTYEEESRTIKRGIK